MFVAQWLSIVGFASVLPFIPFYIRELGVTDENLVPVWAGILGAAAGLTMTIFAPVWGWLSDRHGRKLMVERAMFAGALTTKETYGQAYGLMASMTSLGMTLGPLAGGIMASYVGFRWPFIAVGLLLSLVAMLVIQGVKKF